MVGGGRISAGSRSRGRPPGTEKGRLTGTGQGHASRKLQPSPEVFPSRLPGQVQFAGRRADVGRPVDVRGGDAVVRRGEVALLVEILWWLARF